MSRPGKHHAAVAALMEEWEDRPLWKAPFEKRTYWTAALAVLLALPEVAGPHLGAWAPGLGRQLLAVAVIVAGLAAVFARNGAQTDAETVAAQVDVVAETTAKHLEEAGEPGAAAKVKRKPARKKAAAKPAPTVGPPPTQT